MWGTAVMGEPTPPIPARLIPTDAETLADEADSRPEVGQAPFDEATRQPDPAHGLWKAAKANPASPVALEVYGSLFSQIEKWNFTEEEARAAAMDFAKATEHWGARLQGQMEVDAGLSLAKVRKFIDLAEEFLNAGEGRAPKDSPLVRLKSVWHRTS